MSHDDKYAETGDKISKGIFGAMLVIVFLFACWCIGNFVTSF